MDFNKIYVGDVFDVLKTFPDECVNMVMTSPPYWALRNYKTNYQIWGGDKNCEHVWKVHVQKPRGGKGSETANVGANKNDEANRRDVDTETDFCVKCGAWRGELGLEPTVDLYIKHLCDIFDEVKRVVRMDGSIYVNIGDTYGTKSGSGFINDNLNPQNEETVGETTGINLANELRGTTPEMHKNLCNIPAKFSIEMQNRGWTLRNEIIWHKPNCMPSSAKDRFTVDFEKIYFFTKNKKYYFKPQYDPYTKPIDRWGGEDVKAYEGKYEAEEEIGYPERERKLRPNPLGKNKRTTWYINTKPYKGAHFATYPLDICKTPINASCPEEQCVNCGAPKILSPDKTELISNCDCNAEFEPGVVLDIFMGSGTTAIEALTQNKRYVGVDLNSEYSKLAEDRIKDTFPYYGNDFLDTL